MIIIKNLVFTKINKTHINKKKNILMEKKNQNDCIFYLIKISNNSMALEFFFSLKE